MTDQVGTGQGEASVGRAVTVAELAEAVVADVAPEQLELLPEVSAAWRAGDLARAKDGNWLGGSIGFGVDPGLVVMVVYPIITGATLQLMGVVAKSGSRRLVDRLRRRRPKPPTVLPSSLVDRTGQLRTACYSRALELGVPEPQATLIADAVLGYLVRTAALEPGPGQASDQ